MRVSSVGAPLTGSDIPVPRLSNLIRRAKLAISASIGPNVGSFHANSRCVT